ncbi:MAG: hypothetical protein HKP09_03805, partial [Enterobacterales bacterium]|nr:hypothetical protein [Enterobacterales bacterium]
MKRLMILAALALVATFPTLTADESSWMLRFGAVNVSPNDDSGQVLGGDGIAVGDDTQLGFNITYMYDKNWG